jgi:hypothetical protein
MPWQAKPQASGGPSLPDSVMMPVEPLVPNVITGNFQTAGQPQEGR